MEIHFLSQSHSPTSSDSGLHPSSMEEPLTSLKSDQLLCLASSLRPEWGSTSSPNPLLVIKTGDNITIILKFSRVQSRWAVRLPSTLGEDVRFWKPTLPKFPAPRIHAYDLSYNNPLNLPYIILDWIEGTPLAPFTESWPASAMRIRILDELSDFLLDLLLLPLNNGVDLWYYGVPKGTPHGTSVPTSVWLTESVDRALRRNIIAPNGDVETIIDYLIKRASISEMVVPQYDDVPWVIAHDDLHSGNLIIDDDFHIVGYAIPLLGDYRAESKRIIDWDLTVAMPLQKAAVWPKLLQYTPGNVPPGHSDAIMEHPLDKVKFLEMLKEKELSRRGTTYISSLMETSYERNFFELSMHMKTVHREWVKAHPQTSEGWLKALSQLNELILKEPELNNKLSEKVKEVLHERLDKFQG